MNNEKKSPKFATKIQNFDIISIDTVFQTELVSGSAGLY